MKSQTLLQTQPALKTSTVYGQMRTYITENNYDSFFLQSRVRVTQTHHLTSSLINNHKASHDRSSV